MDGAFISYGRRDDEPFVERLYRDLAAAGIVLWRDRECMRSRGRSFLQEIQDGIADFDRLLLLVGPHALASDYCRAEWEFALDSCRVVLPLFHLGDAALLPPELSRLHGVDFRPPRRYEDALAELVLNLREPAAPLGKLFDIDTPPAHYLARGGPLQALDEALLPDALAPRRVAVGARVAVLHGMAGSGKSVLAAAWARRCFVRRAFPDGLHGLSFGRDGAATSTQDLARFAQSLGERQCLVVADDVWALDRIEALAKALGPRTALLLTTRQVGFAAALGATAVEVGELDELDALDLLGAWAGAGGTLPVQADEVVRECGRLPLALAMAGAMVLADEGAWNKVLKKLRNSDIGRIGHVLKNYPHPNLLRALQASIDALPDEETIARYRELAVFGEDGRFGTSVLRRLWRDDEGSDTDDRVGLYLSRSLLQRSADGTLHLHDLQHDANVAAVGDALPALHRRLLDAYRCGTDGWCTLRDDGYIIEHLCAHLEAAGQDEELRALLEAETSDGQAAWYLARTVADPSGGGYRADLRRWWRRVHDLNQKALRNGGLSARIGLEVRCALSMASLSAQSGRIEPTLLRALIDAGQWSIDTAWAALWQMPDADTVAGALREIAALLDRPRLVRAVRWYLHDHPYNFDSYTLMALLERLVQLFDVDAALALLAGVRPEVHRECEQLLLNAWIDAGQPLRALRALQMLDAGARRGYICTRLAELLPTEALPALARAARDLVDDGPLRYRERVERVIEERTRTAAAANVEPSHADIDAPVDLPQAAQRLAGRRQRWLELQPLDGNPSNLREATGLLSALPEEQRGSAAALLAAAVGAVSDSATRRMLGGELCVCCAALDDTALALTLLSRLCRDADDERMLLARLARAAPAAQQSLIDAWRAQCAQSPEVDVDQARAELRDGAVDAAYARLMRLDADARRPVLVELLPRAPRALRPQIAGELLRAARRLGDAQRLQDAMQALRYALAELGVCDEEAASARRPPNPALWLALGDVEAALTAARMDEHGADSWLATILCHGEMALERRLAIAAEIAEPRLALRALLELRARWPQDRSLIDAALVPRSPGRTWVEPALRLRVAAGALSYNLPTAEELRSDTRSDDEFVERALDHLIARGSAEEVEWFCPLVPRQQLPAARDQLRRWLRLDPDKPALEALFEWAYRDLDTVQAEAEAQRQREQVFSNDEHHAAMTLAHGLGQLALHAVGADRAALLAELRAVASGIDEPFLRDEVLLRVRRLLPAAERAELAERLVGWTDQVLLSERDHTWHRIFFAWVMPALGDLPPVRRHRQFDRLLTAMADRRREEVADLLACASPVLASLGGADALREGLKALGDVGRHWP